MTKNPSHDYRATIRYFYEKEDMDWHQMVHKRGGSIEENIEESVDTITLESLMLECRVEGVLAAFFVVYLQGASVLEGFHVAKEFRTRKFFKEFWPLVISCFEGRSFTTGFCDSNPAAIEHLVKQGFEIEKTVEWEGKKYVVLEFKP